MTVVTHLSPHCGCVALGEKGLICVFFVEKKEFVISERASPSLAWRTNYGSRSVRHQLAVKLMKFHWIFSRWRIVHTTHRIAERVRRR